jgi:2,4-diketo-3-deoxy-L-fuconate hydrolase
VRLVRLGPLGQETPAVIGDDNVLYDITALTADIDGSFLSRGGIAEVQQALDAGTLAPIDDPADGTGLRLGAPIARPMAVICVGMNYAAHARESGAEQPTHPVVFFKHPWEVELGVVIGTRARYLASPAEALEYVAGFTVSNDVSEREHQLEISGGQWSKGKSAETFNPLGPWLVPAKTVGDASGLRLGSFVNGDPRQNSSTSDLIFGVARLVYELSQFMVLEPGDLINTGTPEGVALSGRFPYLTVGDALTTA